MMGRQHLVFGTVSAFAVASAMYGVDIIDMAEAVFLVSGSALGSILPDIDDSRTMIGKRCKPISYLLETTIGHRTYTHDLALWIPIALLFMFHSPFLLGLFFGYLGHLFLDGLTTGGVPIFYLFHKKRIHLLPKFLRFRSDSFRSELITIMFSLLAYLYLPGICQTFFEIFV